MGFFQTPNDRSLHFNGINATTGGEDVPSVSVDAMVEAIRRQVPQPGQLRLLRASLRDPDEPDLDTRDGYDHLNLTEAGWGVVFPEETDPAVEEALEPLLKHRRAQAAADSAGRFRLYRRSDGYRQGESALHFRETRGGALGAVDPDRMPYYLLLVGSPDAIPFGFQFQLDVRHAVGRICFDNPEEYRRYAQSVVNYETGRQVPTAEDLALFAARHEQDPVSRQMADVLTGTLGRRLGERPVNGWRVRKIVGEAATKGRLRDLLGGEDRPDLVFTACHGVSFELHDARRRAHQGAVACQGDQPPWPYFSADDVAADADLRGLVTIHYGCHSGGVPRAGELPDVPPLAPHEAGPFVARLPQRLLANPRGGALAVLAHVGRAYGFSYVGAEGSLQAANFEDLLRRLMRGMTAGWALELINLQFAQLSAAYWAYRDAEQLEPEAARDPQRLLDLYTAVRDAERYLVLGDPAVRLRRNDR